MAKKKTKKVYILSNGERYDVTGETGRYFLCGETQFRKAARRGKVVKEAVEESESEETEIPVEGTEPDGGTSGTETPASGEEESEEE